jgi:hypothetical protein
VLGACNEIYMASLSPGFGGWRASEVTKYLYTHFNALMIAIEGPGVPLSLCPLSPDASVPMEVPASPTIEHHHPWPLLPCAHHPWQPSIEPHHLWPLLPCAHC